MALPSNLSFAEMYERFLVEPLFRPFEDIPFVRDLDQIARQHLGPFTDSRHSYGDGKALAALLHENDFRDVGADTISVDVRGQPGCGETLCEGRRVDVFAGNECRDGACV